MIAYRTKNEAGAEWHDHAFVFRNYKSVEKFFQPENPLLVSIFCDSAGQGFEDIMYFKIHRNGSKDEINPNRITSVTFNTTYAGNVEIVEMYEAYIIGEDAKEEKKIKDIAIIDNPHVLDPLERFVNIDFKKNEFPLIKGTSDIFLSTPPTPITIFNAGESPVLVDNAYKDSVGRSQVKQRKVTNKRPKKKKRKK